MDNNLTEENKVADAVPTVSVTEGNPVPVVSTGTVEADADLLENEAEVEVLGQPVEITPAPVMAETVVTPAPISPAPVATETVVTPAPITPAPALTEASVPPTPVSPVTMIENTNVEVVPTVEVTQVETTLPSQDMVAPPADPQGVAPQEGEVSRETVEEPTLDSVTVSSVVTGGETPSQSDDQSDEEKQNLITREDCVLQGEHYRISVLTERLVRLEYSPNGVFYDNKTQWVQFRNFNKPEFEVTEDEKFLVIKTKYFALSYSKEKNFDGGKIVPSSNLRVELNDTDHAWYYKHPEVKNYKGLFVGLDGNDNDMKLRNGLYSLDGFATIDDSNSYIYDEDSKLTVREHPGIDIYLFMYNNDFDLALKDYFQLTGMPPMIPRYALGNWWSRDLPYTDEEIHGLVNSFEKRGIPLSILLLDQEWHIPQSEDKKILDTGYTFNKDLIPDPGKLMSELHEKNIHVGVLYNPKDGIYPHEEHYPEIAEMFGVSDKKVIAFDPFNPALLDAISKKLLRPLRDLGVDFFWNDYKETDQGLGELWAINRFLLNEDPTNRTLRNMTLARSALIAPHTQPITYSGKTMVGWDMLKKIPFYNQSASNMGVSWISHDVAGNYGGIEEEELYIRSIELATFSPILRFHAPAGRYYKKEPWRWNARTLEVVDDYLKLRHQLIPYIYSKAFLYHHDGIPLIKPLYRELSWVYDDKNFTSEYYFGELLISPILSKKDVLINRTIHKFFLPEGVWYDFKTGKKFPGNKQYVAFFRDEDYPVFAKKGAIIPLDNSEKPNFTGTPESLEIHVFPGESNSFQLYDDDGTSDMYKDNQYILTQIEYNYLPSNYTIIVRNTDGARNVLPDYRNYKIRFRNTKKAGDIMAYFNDTELETVSYVDDADFVIEVSNVPSFGQLTINCKGNDIEIDAVRLINDEIDSILLDLQINTVLKEKISNIMFSDLPLKKKRIEIRKLSKFNLTRQYIRLFLKLLEYIGEI